MSYIEPKKVGDVVWAKMNSFPYWPARIATIGEAYSENHKTMKTRATLKK